MKLRLIVWKGNAPSSVVIGNSGVTLLRALRPDVGGLGSQSGVGRVMGDWQRRGGRAPYSAVLLSTSTTRERTQEVI